MLIFTMFAVCNPRLLKYTNIYMACVFYIKTGTVNSLDLAVDLCKKESRDIELSRNRMAGNGSIYSVKPVLLLYLAA